MCAKNASDDQFGVGWQVDSYRRRLQDGMFGLQGTLDGLCRYLEGGMVDSSIAMGVVRPGHWKCPNCPSVQRKNVRRCKVCKAWQPR